MYLKGFLSTFSHHKVISNKQKKKEVPGEYFLAIQMGFSQKQMPTSFFF